MTSNELCFSTTCKFNATTLIPKFFFYDLSFIFSFIVSHPLYFLYFIFFSSYFFKFIFFILPLFFTTTLLLLCIVATTFPPTKLGFIQTIVDKLRSKLNDVDEAEEQFHEFEDFEIYSIVFRDPPLITVGDDQSSVTEVTVTKSEERLVEASTTLIKMPDNETRSPVAVSFSSAAQNPAAVTKSGNVRNLVKLLEQLDRFEDSTAALAAIELPVNKMRSSVEVTVSGKHQNPAAVTKSEDVKSLEKLFEHLDRFEDSTAAIELPELETIPDLVKVVEELQKLQPAVMKKLDDKKTVETSFSRSNSWRMDSSSTFGSYGSMRNEKEWKRTLACKLFEERHNSEGGEEGMDSLWESYEGDKSSKKSNKTENESMIDKKKTKKNMKTRDFSSFDEDEFIGNGQLCCLKAFKLSTGKMNLGMGKPNLVKISKAIKGFGWLHHVGNKHGKRL